MNKPLLLTGLLIAVTVIVVWPNRASIDERADSIDYTQLLQPAPANNKDNAMEFSTVTAPRQLVFPRDHGPHPDYRLEWWYLSGQLRTDKETGANTNTHKIKDDRRWGFQLTFFRLALKPERQQRSGWQSSQLYMAHFALSDVQNQRHIAFERLSRTGPSLAGAQHTPVKIWLENWQLEAEQIEHLFPAKLKTLANSKDSGNVGLTLTLENKKPVVLQGERGFSPKSATPGNASHYYSYTRLKAQGELLLGELEIPVMGEAWLDHEWSTSSLDQNQEGWDWFSLQLDDGRELMFYQLRLKNGSADPFSRGVLVDQNGSYQTLLPSDITLTPLQYWQSPTGSRYPVEWEFRISKHQLSLKVEPLFKDQEWRERLRYWEGAVRVTGSHQGHGYLELSGY